MRTESLDLGARTAVDMSSPPKAGRASRSWWPLLAGCFAVAAVLRIWGSAAHSGLGNSYYTATALSMSRDWTTFLAGGLDTGHFISMDKPAVWLWPSALLIKAFGLNWATLFLPTALAGALSVVVLALAVREGGGDTRAAGAVALLAALGLAVSPMNVGVDRTNSPDAFLLLALLLAAWMTLRAVRRARPRALLGAAALVGLAFDAKYLQAYVVVPALALVWLVGGAGPIRRRLAWLGGAAVSLVASSALWPVLVSLIPSADRPWIVASTDGSVFGRVKSIFGLQLGTPAAQDGMAAQVMNAFHTGEVFYSGKAGAGRLFSGVPADQVSWWLPLAVLGAVSMALGLRGRRRTDPAIAGLVLWSGWTVCCWAVFSFMGGVLHPYYTNMLVPSLAALSAGGLVTSWTAWRRGETAGTALLAAQVLVAAGWAVMVLRDTSAQRPAWLAVLVVVAGALALIGMRIARGRLGAAVIVGVLTAVSALAAPVAWSVRTADQTLSGTNPLANQNGRYELAVLPPPLAAAFDAATRAQVDPRLLDFLERNRGDARWMVATLNAMSASPLIVASGGRPVMAMGGFDGSDPTPTLEGFRRLVGSGAVRFVLAPPPGPGTAAFVSGPAIQVTQWATRACRPIDPVTGAPAAVPTAAPQGPPMPILLDCRGA